MAPRAPCSSDLSPNAPLFVPRASILRPPAAPMLACYLPPPAELLPPLGLPAGPFPVPTPPQLFTGPFQAPTPPPLFPCPFQGPPSPPVFASPFQGPPPLPGFFRPPFMGFTPPVLGVAPTPTPTPHGPMALPAASVPVTQPPLPRRTADPKDGGGKPPSDSARTWRVASGRRRPKPLLPPRQRAPACGEAAAADGGRGGPKKETEKQPSPRSVLDEAATSPPDSPPVVLPPAFPYPAPTPSSQPAAVTRGADATEPRCHRVPPTGSKPVQPRSPQHAPGQGARSRGRMPRRFFNPARSLTTLMVRNIPNGFTRNKMMNILDQHCAVENEKITSGGGGGVSSEYDFLYVPFDFRTNANKGYCFVNVTTPEAARRLWVHLHGYKWKTRESHKTCEVDYATIQGREELVSHFSGSYFDCGQDNEKFLPVWFEPPRDGAHPAKGRPHVVGHLGRRSS